MAIVTDASVCLAMCFQDESSDYAVRVANVMRETDALVPPVWPLEMTNSLLVALRRKRITDGELKAARGFLLGLPIRIAEMDRSEIFGRVSTSAVAHNLSTYDASYLYLAMRENVPLATLDARLSAAAAAAGCALFE